MRTLLSLTFPCRRGCFTKCIVHRAPPSETMLQLAFRRVCMEEGIGLKDGLPEEVLASVIAVPGEITVEEAKTHLRLSPSFRVDAGLVHLTGQSACDQNQMEAMLLNVANKIPSTGVNGAQFRAILEDEVPYFHPSSVGALSLKDALQRYPRSFAVETDASGKWFVRPAIREEDNKSSTASSGAAHRIVRYCRERALMGNQNDYVPLRVAMREEGVVDEDVLEHLVNDSNCNGHMQMRFTLKLRPKRPSTNAICFVDGDEIGVPVVDAIWREMNLSDQSTRLVARQPTSHKHSSSDIIAPTDMPTYALVERKARELALSQSVVLQDVIYVCSSRQFPLYADHVAQLNTFPDADVYVCCPSKVKLVAQKQFVPL